MLQQMQKARFKRIRSGEGFTLIELMIVVAIIGILAAIAIPNFLQYQRRARTSEARTNLGAIRTSETTFYAENGCYLDTAQWPAPIAAVGVVKLATPWAAGLPVAVVPPAAGWCVAITKGNFNNLNYAPIAAVYYSYGVDTQVNVAPLVTVVLPATAPCVATGAAGGTDVPVNNGYIATATSNLDGDALLSTFALGDASGTITDCTPGTF